MRDRSVEDLAPLPGLPAIPELVDRVRAAGLPVELTCDPGELTERGSDGEPPVAAGLAAYRLVQESLTNVVRHAGPVPTRVEVVRAGDRLVVTVANEAPPAPVIAVEGGGRGLVGMRARVDALGGDFEAGPGPGGGFRVRASLPFPARGAR